MEPGTGLTVLGAAFGSAKVLEKMLGPTAEFLGGGLKDWTERGCKNLAQIFTVAKDRLGDRINDEGGIPPRVLKEVLQEGPFCEDRLWAEYFGGVLASSRTGVERDDRGARIAGLLGRLSTYQVRTHFAIYTLFKRLFDGSDISPSLEDGRRMLRMFIPSTTYESLMEFEKGETPSIILAHSVVGLVSESLLGDYYQFGSHDYIKRHFPEAPSAGLMVEPSTLGVELFYWAHGLGDIPVGAFLQPTIKFDSTIELASPKGVRSLGDPQRLLD